jgi:atypical dual specificity phosphatase
MLLKRMLGSFAIVVSATTLIFAVLIVTKHRKLKKELQEVDVNSINLERYSVTTRVENLPYVFKWAIGRMSFFPTLFYNVILDYFIPELHWYSRIDNNIILGALPFWTIVPALHKDGVRGVINTCEEFSGPQRTYVKHGIAQIRLPCIDYCSPTLDQIETAMKFIAEHVNRGESVYIHCKGGKGRSATVVLAYLMQFQAMTRQQAQRFMISKRRQVSRYLWQRKVLVEFEKKYDLPREGYRD